MELRYYDCKLSYSWSGKYSSFDEIYNFYVNELEEIPDKVKRFILEFTRKFAGSKYDGQTDRYGLYIGAIEICPIYEKFTLYPNNNTQLFLKNEYNNVGKMLENNTLFENNSYNKTLSEDNIGLEIGYITYEKMVSEM